MSKKRNWIRAAFLVSGLGAYEAFDTHLENRAQEAANSCASLSSNACGQLITKESDYSHNATMAFMIAALVIGVGTETLLKRSENKSKPPQPKL